MRGSRHDKDIHEFGIDEKGMHIGKSFSNVAGILAGHPMQVTPVEVERIGGLFKE